MPIIDDPNKAILENVIENDEILYKASDTLLILFFYYTRIYYTRKIYYLVELKVLYRTPKNVILNYERSELFKKRSEASCITL